MRSALPDDQSKSHEVRFLPDAVVSGLFHCPMVSVLRTIASTCMGGAEGNTEPVIVSWPPISRAGGMPQVMRGGEETGSST